MSSFEDAIAYRENMDNDPEEEVVDTPFVEANKKYNNLVRWHTSTISEAETVKPTNADLNEYYITQWCIHRTPETLISSDAVALETLMSDQISEIHNYIATHEQSLKDLDDLKSWHSRGTDKTQQPEQHRYVVAYVDIRQPLNNLKANGSQMKNLHL